MSDLVASLRFRLLVGLVVVFGLGSLAMITFSRLQALGAHQAIEETSLLTQARQLLGGVRLDGQGRLVGVDAPPNWREAYQERDGAYFTLFDASGRAVARSSNLTGPLAWRPLTSGQSVSPLRIEGTRQDLVLSARGPGGYQLTVARTNPGLFDSAEPDVVEDTGPALILGVFAMLGLLVAWAVAVFSLRPLVKASQEAALVGPGSNIRLTEAGLPTEARPLARAVNAALDRVTAAYEGEKRFTADAAHALRTPLTVLDLRLQGAEDQGRLDLPGIRRDLGDLARLVSGLLSLSRADGGARAERRPVNLARLAREVAAALTPRLDAAGRTIEVKAPSKAEVWSADAGALSDMIAVLVDNALCHGRGHISVAILSSADAHTLWVADEGRGVIESQWEAVFDRFHKLDANAPGAGLGLAIVRQTARNHGGDAAFSEPAMIVVHLPR